MSENLEINHIASYDEEMKEQLQEFCRQVIRLGVLIDKAIALDGKMSRWERKFSWLPFARKDRYEEFQKYEKENVALRKSIIGIYEETCHKLDFLISRLEEAVKDADSGQKEAVVLRVVLEAFKGFDRKFRSYNWFFRFGKNESNVSFRDRYPDARRLYQNS